MERLQREAESEGIYTNTCRLHSNFTENVDMNLCIASSEAKQKNIRLDNSYIGEAVS